MQANFVNDDGNWTDLGDVNATQLTDVLDGEHTIEVLIRDLAGNSGSDFIVVTIQCLYQSIVAVHTLSPGHFIYYKCVIAIEIYIITINFH